MGRGWAIIWQDYGFDHDNLWTVEIAATRQFWTFRNRDVRGVKNCTFGVGMKQKLMQQVSQQGTGE